MTNDQTVTQALEPCPLCQSPEVEFGGYGRGVYCIICKDCCIQTKFYPSRDAAATAWNTRTAHSGEGRDAIIERCARIADGWNRGRDDRVTETSIAAAIRDLSGEGRSNGAGEVDPSKMSVEMAELFGLVCKLNRLKTERDDLMRTDGGFSVIERAADMMDEIVDAMPALQSAFGKVCEREHQLLAALSAPQGEVERLREAVLQAARWFEKYAVDHEVKARQASDSYEQASRADKAKRNQELADYLRAALAQPEAEAK